MSKPHPNQPVQDPDLSDIVQPIQLPPEEELLPLYGQWVAVVRGVVVGASKNPRTAMNRARANGHALPLLFRAPLMPPGKAFYQFAPSPIGQWQPIHSS